MGALTIDMQIKQKSKCLSPTNDKETRIREQ